MLGLVSLAVMPRGVEHGNTDQLERCLLEVSLAVMPRGVEHLLTNSPIAAVTVPLAVMPRGVEHGTVRLVLTKAESSSGSDAERR
ncbi:hypothetical protein [Archangium violaceum]|uniref:hypothetical protein n=1 Tax=Archangium violaceum TaxID=83451 RepID=UPI00406A70D6